MEEQQTMTLTAKKMPERQISDPGPIAELKFEPSQIPVIAEIENHETLGTDMIMLQKADLWMSQFKKRLNFGIIVMVMLWTGVSYYKSIEMPTDIPEAELLVAHDDAESKDSTLVDLMESDRLLRPVSAEVVATENLTESEAGDAPALDEKVAATAMDKSPDRFLRNLAEMDNMRRRQERERQDLLKYASEKLLQDLLPVLDSFEKASSAGGVDAGNAVIEGIRMVHKQLVTVLENNGLKPVAATGKPFDPNFHQAIQKVEVDDVEQETVKDEFQRGYLLNGRLIRPSMVSVLVPKSGSSDSK